MTRIFTILAAALLTAVGAFASEPTGGKRQAAPAASAPFSFTGFYLGALAGMAMDGGSEYTYTVAGNYEPAGRPRPTDLDDDILYGGFAGYQFQLPIGIVVGAEAAVIAGKMRGVLKENPPPAGNDYQTKTDGDLIYMATGRIGYAYDRLHVYGKAGWAWTETDFEATFYNRDGPMGSNGSQVKIANKFEWDGFVWGAGAEFAITPNLILGVEYMRMDFGSSDEVTLRTTNSGITQEKLKANHEVDTLMARLSVKF